MPTFWFGILLILLFSLYRGWLGKKGSEMRESKIDIVVPSSHRPS